jgi:hypothetical protein
MTLKSLFAFIQREMALQGFSLSKVVGSSVKRAVFVLGDELRLERLSGDFACDVVRGICVEARVVPHANQAEGDASYSLEIRRWDRGRSEKIDSARLPKWRTEATLRSYMSPLIRKYKEMVEEIELEKAVEEAMAGPYNNKIGEEGSENDA